jgi:hypothetical protein
MPRELNVDWDSVAKGEAVPEGRYATRIDKVEDKTSPNNNEYWLMTFTITDEPDIGRKVFGNFMLSPTALWKLRALMKAIGMPTQGLVGLNADDYIGAEVGVVVVHQLYEGEVRARVQSFFPLGK